MSFMWDCFCRCFQQNYQSKNDYPMDEEKSIMKKNFESSTALFCNEQYKPYRSRTNSGNTFCDAAITPISSPYHLRSWELDPSTVYSESIDYHYELTGSIFDCFITSTSTPYHTASELYVHNKEQQIIMNMNAACNLEKLVQRLETATLRLEALGAQKPLLAPKPTKNGTPPPAITFWLCDPKEYSRNLSLTNCH
ncbi:Glutamate receptor ionotropic, NMDA 2C [Dirofilaria immitis]